jgi:hypothetical protein
VIVSAIRLFGLYFAVFFRDSFFYSVKYWKMISVTAKIGVLDLC